MNEFIKFLFINYRHGFKKRSHVYFAQKEYPNPAKFPLVLDVST